MSIYQDSNDSPNVSFMLHNFAQCIEHRPILTFDFLLKSTLIRLYLPLSNWFLTRERIAFYSYQKQNFFWFITQKGKLSLRSYTRVTSPPDSTTGDSRLIFSVPFSYFLFIFYLPRCTQPDFPFVSFLASLPFLPCFHHNKNDHIPLSWKIISDWFWTKLRIAIGLYQKQNSVWFITQRGKLSLRSDSSQLESNQRTFHA